MSNGTDFVVQVGGTPRRRRRQGSTRRQFYRGLMAVTALSVVVCGGGVASANAATSGSPRTGGSLTVIMNGNTFPTMDPSVAASESNNYALFAAIYGGLFETNVSGNPVPDLATGYHESKDGLTYTIYLRKGVKFSDGTPFNSTAVAFNFDRNRNPQNASLGITYVEDIASIGTPNPYTVVLHMSRAYAPLIIAITTSLDDFMVSPTAFSADGEADFGLHPVGAGPFIVSSFNPNVSMAVTRNPKYWDSPQPYLNSVNFTYLNNSTTGYETVLAAGKSGAQVDFGGATTPQTAKQAKTAGGVQVIRPPATGEYFVHFNTFVPPFNSLAAREAVAYATDNVLVNRAVFRGLNRVVDAMGSPGAAFYPSKPLPSYLGYNPTKAKQLVTKLGGLSFTIMCVPCSYAYLTQADALQQLWSQVGINATVVNLSEPQAVARFTSGDFETTMSSWTDVDPAIQMGEFVASNGTLNHGQADPYLATLVNEAATASAPATRAALYLKIYNYINKSVYNLPTVTTSAYDIESENVQGFGANPNVYLEQVWLSK